MIPPWVYLAGGALALSASFGAGWTVRGWKADSDELEQVTLTRAAIDAQRKVADAAAMGFEDTRAALDRQAYDTQTIIRETYREIAVPAECAVPAAVADSLRDATEATNRAVAGQPPRAMPATATASGAAD
ncbi:hypothetical protein ACIPPQ_20090 [Sphingopyxis sp. LARHCG72]